LGYFKETNTNPIVMKNKIIGGILLAIPAFVLIWSDSRERGWGYSVAVWLSIIVLVGCVVGGIFLIIRDDE